VVCTNYATKWVEARAIAKATKQVVANFLYEEIFSRYDTPREIISDGGEQFTSQMLARLM